MAELFLFGTFWFWVLTVVAVIIVTACVENERGTWATVCLLVYVGLMQWCGGVTILSTILYHPIYTAALFVAYFCIGTIWGVAKWAIFVKGRTQNLLEMLRDYCEEYELPYTRPIDQKTWKLFMEQIQKEDRKYGYNKIDLVKATQIGDHKDQFIRWLSFWPVSMLYTLLNDVARNIYLVLAKRLQAISDGIYRRSVPADLTPPEKEVSGDLEEI